MFALASSALTMQLVAGCCPSSNRGAVWLGLASLVVSVVIVMNKDLDWHQILSIQKHSSPSGYSGHNCSLRESCVAPSEVHDSVDDLGIWRDLVHFPWKKGFLPCCRCECVNQRSVCLDGAGVSAFKVQVLLVGDHERWQWDLCPGKQASVARNVAANRNAKL
mmetsp:Transcript_19808/g.42853  ORF Transcript_19808/g.42853 Transcript_19808/m.42853 type:complete len:163 (-) Transcript_19808:399-887(-)